MGTVRILILGGTTFLGRATAMAAVGRGHDVTCVARGTSGAPAAGATFVRVDRDDEYGLAEVAARRWHAVVDVASDPHHVARAVRDVGAVTRLYVLVSTVNVYEAFPGREVDESSARLAPLPVDDWGPPTRERYGAAKVACEDLVTAGLPASAAAIVRPGLIGGPGDETGRSGYWPWRFAHPTGPRVLVPDSFDQPVQLLDVRDLAEWLVVVCERRVTGAFNAAGARTTLGRALDLCRERTTTPPDPAPAAPAWLLDRGVAPWSGPRSLPLWLGGGDETALVGAEPATAAGLRLRPLAATLADALAYEERRREPPPHGAGLTDADEAALLADLA